MRKIDLLETDILGGKLVYRDLLKAILLAPKGDARSVSFPEMREANKVLDKLNAAEGALLLEDSEWTFTRDRVEAAPFSSNDPAILAFAVAVLEAPIVAVSEAQ